MKESRKDSEIRKLFLVSIYAITIIFILEIIALYKGIDGAVLSASFTLIGGIIGALVKAIIDLRKKK